MIFYCCSIEYKYNLYSLLHTYGKNQDIRLIYLFETYLYISKVVYKLMEKSPACLDEYRSKKSWLDSD